MAATDAYDVKFGKANKNGIHFTILAEGLTIERDLVVDFDFVTGVTEHFYQMNAGTDGTGGLIPMIKVVEAFLGVPNYRLFRAAAKKAANGSLKYESQATAELFELCLEKVFPKAQDWAEKESDKA